MAKLAVDQKMETFNFDTPFEKGLDLATVAAGKKTVLLFLRYLGCTLCRLDMHLLREKYGEITGAGGQLLVALQSDPALVARETASAPFPFTIICDPGQELYRRFEIKPAKSKLALAGGKTLAKISQLKKYSFTHGEYEGDELQLPACFVLDSSFTIRYAKYAKNLADIPGPEEMVKILEGL
ncbi:MAG: redoxin domain-containing protein [Treponema sp.]|jgi:peroxiredoxin|nr:redoxin domain-containing protein [Treponema sp.]